MKDKHPLVSFCLKFYKQRQFCENALLAAFAQTYSPLEIIVTDDGSADGSVEHINSIIAAYQAATPRERQHKVVILHNDRNLGSAKTLERQFKAAKGELLVQADGDDISFPDRVTCVVDAWVSTGCTAGCIVHDSIWLFGTSRRSTTIDGSSSKYPYGAVATYSRAVIDMFPDIVFNDTCDDVIFTRRGFLSGDLVHVPKPLIYYRQGFGLTSSKESFDKLRIKMCGVILRGMRQAKADIAWCQAKSLVDSDRIFKARLRVRKTSVRKQAELTAFISPSLSRRYAALRIYLKSVNLPMCSVLGIELAMVCLPRHFLRKMSCLALQFWWSFKHWVQSSPIDVRKEIESWNCCIPVRNG